MSHEFYLNNSGMMICIYCKSFAFRHEVTDGRLNKGCHAYVTISMKDFMKALESISRSCDEQQIELILGS